MAEEEWQSNFAGQEDINEKLLLDLAWERQQKKVRACGVVWLALANIIHWFLSVQVRLYFNTELIFLQAIYLIVDIRQAASSAQLNSVGCKMHAREVGAGSVAPSGLFFGRQLQTNSFLIDSWWAYSDVAWSLL